MPNINKKIVVVLSALITCFSVNALADSFLIKHLLKVEKVEHVIKRTYFIEGKYLHWYWRNDLIADYDVGAINLDRITEFGFIRSVKISDKNGKKIYDEMYHEEEFEEFAEKNISKIGRMEVDTVLTYDRKKFPIDSWRYDKDSGNINDDSIEEIMNNMSVLKKLWRSIIKR